jgi:3-oxoacyl-[acyl-carrier protein] reductase
VSGRFAGKALFLTGGSSGIGRATVLRLLREGADVAFTFVAGRPADREQAAQVVAQAQAMGRRARAFEADVRDAAALDAAVQATVKDLGTIHLLVAGAGVADDRVHWKMSEESWDRVLDVNLKGVFLTCRAVSPILRAQGYGRIVTISSIVALHGKAGLANYAASKAALIGFTKTLARELGPRGITVNAVAPGFIKTPLTAELPPEQLDELTRAASLGRLGEPEDVADVIAFLLSEDARYVTGEVVRVDGGQGM